MAAIPIVHRPDRKALAQLNTETDGQVETVIPFREIQTSVNRCAYDRYVFAHRSIVGLLARRRTNTIRTRADKQRGRRFGFREHEEGK